jgi:hypothetical protein
MLFLDETLEMQIEIGIQIKCGAKIVARYDQRENRCDIGQIYPFNAIGLLRSAYLFDSIGKLIYAFS